MLQREKGLFFMVNCCCKERIAVLISVVKRAVAGVQCQNLLKSVKCRVNNCCKEMRGCCSGSIAVVKCELQG